MASQVPAVAARSAKRARRQWWAVPAAGRQAAKAERAAKARARARARAAPRVAVPEQRVPAPEEPAQEQRAQQAQERREPVREVAARIWSASSLRKDIKVESHAHVTMVALFRSTIRRTISTVAFPMTNITVINPRLPVAG
jgi:hypothetical protein